jgi:hypothetical protein
MELIVGVIIASPFLQGLLSGMFFTDLFSPVVSPVFLEEIIVSLESRGILLEEKRGWPLLRFKLLTTRLLKILLLFDGLDEESFAE